MSARTGWLYGSQFKSRIAISEAIKVLEEFSDDELSPHDIAQTAILDALEAWDTIGHVIGRQRPDRHLGPARPVRARGYLADRLG